MNRAALLAPFLLSAMVLALPTNAKATGLAVSPSLLTVHNIEPGREYDVYRDTGARLTIYNDDETARTWALSLHRPSERGRWETGYGEIPDPEWCWFDEKEITVAPHDKGYVNLHLKIPDEERYYNQHWVVTASIGGAAGGELIALAVDVRMLLETKPRTGLREAPDGALGIEPSMVRFEGLLPGKEEKGRVVLHNNDDAPHDYAVVSLFADPETKLRSYLTGSFSALPDHEWIMHEKKINIGPRGSVAFDLKVRIPDDENTLDGKWEEILLIRPDEGIPGFIRVQMATRATAEE